MSVRISFTKMDGTGNDFVVVDARDRTLSRLRWPAVSRALCNRRRSIGADGLLVLERSPRADVRMRIFNADGSEPSTCGNGLRCVALYASRKGIGGRRLTVQTKAGITQARIERGGRVSVDLVAPRLLRHLGGLRLGAWVTAHADLIDAGVPHLVCWVDTVRAVRVDGVGRRLRRHRRFAPHGANVDFIQLMQGRSQRLVIAMRTYERGVEAETQACGTGAVASAASAVHAVLMSRPAAIRHPGRFRVDVRVPGGLLQVELTARRLGGRVVFGRAVLKGSVRTVSHGSANINGSRR